MSDTAASLTDTRKFFGMTAQEFSAAWKGLTAQDKIDIREGIGNGSLTY